MPRYESTSRHCRPPPNQTPRAVLSGAQNASESALPRSSVCSTETCFTPNSLANASPVRRLRKAAGAPVYISKLEEAEGAEEVEEGKRFRVGSLEIEARLTSGHSPGGMTYVITGLSRPVAIVGDSLFAGSMGGGNVSYEDALRNNREKILTLPGETIVCPGHGPLTTVGKEKRDNPFFAR